MRPGRIALAALLAVLASAAGATPLPRGKRTPRPKPTHVVVRAAELDAGGVRLRVAPGVPVVAGAGGVTLLGDVQVSGRLPGSALGLGLARDADLLDARGAVVGKVRAGAFVRAGARAGGRIAVEPATPLSPSGRFMIDAAALTAEPPSLVLPVNELALLVVRSRTTVGVAELPPGARVEPLVPADERGRLRVRSYGAFAIEGLVPADRLAPSDATDLPAPPAQGLTPNHEALVETPIFAAGRAPKPIGTLRGGALVTAGVEVEGARVKVMTHGPVVGEVWVAQAALRRLEASVWSEAR
jgi:hypothetical protein